VFPKSQRNPPHPLVFSLHDSISFFVLPYFLTPKLSVRCWHAAMPSATVPEARIQEHDDLFTDESNVRFSGQPIHVFSVPETRFAQRFPQTTLNLGVFSLDVGHYFASFFL
jgi:hypothetical protein